MNVIFVATPDYKRWVAICPQCRGDWIETNHDLYNVCSLVCPWCSTMLGVDEGDFHGDDAGEGC